MIRIILGSVAGLLTGFVSIFGTAVAGMIVGGDIGFILGVVVSPVFATIGFLGGFTFLDKMSNMCAPR